ncbi:MAG: peptidylprolyl isomerase [Firmicutes bacterium]|nr:peptidylprolyl isomerase [Bacillota bacterium]
MNDKILGAIRFTNGKKINFELYPEIAPISVANFVELIKEGFYDGLCFHRVIPNFMIQGGGMIAKGKGLAEKRNKKTIKGEFRSNGVDNPLKHTAGVFSMARTSVNDSATSQFFICVADVHFLDGNYAGFGKVADDESLAVAIAISQVETGNVEHHSDVPIMPIEIQTIELV